MTPRKTEGICKRCGKIYKLDNPVTHGGARSRFCGEECRTETRREVMRRAKLKAAWGMTVEAYESLLQIQGGRCAICRKPQGREKKRLAVDHNHKTGQIRGLLCGMCNHKLLNAAKDNPVILRRASQYLEHPPAVTGTMGGLLRKGED